ncbi:uncharacterized protein LOC123651220 [Pipistrellus kuhlii]|uniref:uncharacterized protein LOC123651220 n=1 Tax=Pipistrellus kuhlii TaxID=59472 RepID=UPI001E26F804|nr:uncharacterized protein LOC123651220 [Pipistrellus kuhlii]
MLRAGLRSDVLAPALQLRRGPRRLASQGQLRDHLQPPTHRARSTLGPRAAVWEWAPDTLAPAPPSSWTGLAVRRGRRCVLRGPGAARQVGLALRFIPWLPPTPSSAGHRTRGCLPRADLRALPSLPALPGGLTMTPSTGTGPGVTAAVQDLAFPILQPGTSPLHGAVGLPALPEVLPARDRKSRPSPERRRPHATQRFGAGSLWGLDGSEETCAPVLFAPCRSGPPALPVLRALAWT